MVCRIARRYGGWPHEVARWPLHYYLAVRDEMVREWVGKARASRMAAGGDGRSIDMTPRG